MAKLTIQQTFELALRHHEAGRLNEAERLYRQILAQEPQHPGAIHYLGTIAHQVGQLDAALDLIGRAIALNPNYAEAHFSMGNLLKTRGNLDQAIAAYRRAIAVKPEFPEAYNNLGNALRDAGQLDEAIAACRQAIACRGNFHEAHNNLGIALANMGQLTEAIAAYRQAIALKPNNFGAYNNLGNALQATGQMNEAIAAYHQAITLKPNYAEAYSHLGNALKDVGQLDEAIAAIRQAIALKPDSADAYNNLGNALKDTGQLDEAIAAFRQSTILNSSSAQTASNLILCLHYHPGYDAAAIAREHRQWNQNAESLRRYIRPLLNDRNPGRRLRIGYVSPDLREHVNGWNILPLLEQHDRHLVEIFAYAQVPVPDAMTQRLRRCTEGWRSLVGLTDAQAADLIRQDNIDILVDLAGHTAGNRLLIFAHRPAPVQVTYLGYPNTTGLSTMDYRLTDAYADPPGLTERYHSEQLVRLDPCAWCFRPTQAPPLSPRQDGPITYGCFNNFAKVTEPMLRLWGRILQAMPKSRLMLKAVWLGNPSTRRRVYAIMEQAGIGSERLELHGYVPGYAGHLALYGKMDIALDTYPYHGTNTTWEALWMGVPVVTLAGQSHVSRVGVSLLNNMGLPELVAGSEDEYLQIGVKLANDLPRLQELRATLRQRMEASPLMDEARYASTIEAAYRQMWRKWCAA